MKLIPYNSRYEASVQQLYATPIPGRISLSLMRNPDSQIGAQVQTEEPKMFLVIDRHETVIGIFNIGSRRHYLKGKVVSLPYFCDLRIHKDYQNSSVLLRMLKYVHALNLKLNQLPATTAVFADNLPMLRMIAKAQRTSIAIIPYYQKIAEIETFIFENLSKPVRSSRYDFIIRKATLEDIPSMKKLQKENQRDFMIPYEFEKLSESGYYYNLRISDFVLLYSQGVLTGMIGTWNTSGFKQTKVHMYHWTIKLLRPFYNLIASYLLGFPSLVNEGELIKTIQLHSVIIRHRDKDVFLALLQYIVNENTSPLMLTLDQQDPLYACMRQAKKAIKKKGYIYQVTESEELEKPGWIPIDVPRI